MPQRSISKCEHTATCLSPSPHAAIAGFRRQGKRQRLAAVKADNRDFPREDKLFFEEDDRAFPGPLLLPGDDLAGDSEDPQSFQQWLDGEHRNPVTAKQKTIYIVPSPQIDPDVNFMRTWTTPKCPDHDLPAQPPSTKDVQDYLSAFYHGLPVKMMPPSTLRFIPWEEPKRKPRKKTGPQYLGLQSGDECVRIRSRTMSNAVYEGQVNLDDLLDVAISILPKDAYSLLILVDFDLYEDDEDEFVCGRAYGGSRVAVVSSARYNPKLDIIQNVERLHAWPASHCEKYMSACASTEPSAKRQKRSQVNSRGSQISTLGLNSPAKEMQYRSTAPCQMWIHRLRYCRRSGWVVFVGRRVMSWVTASVLPIVCTTRARCKALLLSARTQDSRLISVLSIWRRFFVPLQRLRLSDIGLFWLFVNGRGMVIHISLGRLLLGCEVG